MVCECSDCGHVFESEELMCPECGSGDVIVYDKEE